MIVSDGRKIKVYNYSQDILYAGKVVLIKGKKASLATSTNSENMQYILGICVTTISPSSYGEVLLEGTISKINTSSYATSTILYLNSGEGGITDVAPAEFSETYIIGHVLTSDIEGEIYFKVIPPVIPPIIWGTIDGDINNQDDLVELLDTKQDTLISGTNIKTINTNSILGSGDLTITSTTTWGSITGTLADQTDLQAELDAKVDLEDVNPICKLTENITKGQAVYISGANGTNMLVTKASNAAEISSSKTFGLLSATGVTNDQIRIITIGFLHSINTDSASAAGDPVWLGVDGELIYGYLNKPHAPAHLVFIGIVTRKHATQGEIYVRVQNGFELEELHNVVATSPNRNDFLIFNADTNLWESTALNRELVTDALGFTPYDDTNPSGFIDSTALTPYQESITLTTTGSSGPATLVGNTLNIPEYSGGGGGSSSSNFFVSGSATGLAAATTRYGNIAGSTAESQVRLPLSSACTISDLYVRTTATMNASASLKVSVFKNGTITALTLTIAGGSAAGTYSDTANSVSFAAGDGWVLGYTNAGSVAAAASSGQSVKITI